MYVCMCVYVCKFVRMYVRLYVCMYVFIYANYLKFIMHKLAILLVAYLRY